MVLRHGIGVKVNLENVGLALISETPGRVVVAIDPSKANQLSELAKSKDIKLSKIGTTGGDALVINDAVISLEELRKSHTETFAKLFG
jgi:phosphoribosylformylglycinamidine synthase